jgi:hypothetical protein
VKNPWSYCQSERSKGKNGSWEVKDKPVNNSSPPLNPLWEFGKYLTENREESNYHRQTWKKSFRTAPKQLSLKWLLESWLSYVPFLPLEGSDRQWSQGFFTFGSE